MSQLNRAIKQVFRSFGLEISRRQTVPSPLLYHRINLLLDVGANVGQYALSARAEGYANRIVSFEPLPSAHEILTHAAKPDSSWFVHERCALGSLAGETPINISKNSYSSSLLPMLSSHSAAAPDSVYIGAELTNVITLDSIFDRYRRSNERVFLKIDTQGFEKEVLDGASASLNEIMCVQLELSLLPLYESQHLYDYFLEYLKNAGFDLWTIIPGFSDTRTGQLLQFDGVFFRK